MEGKVKKGEKIINERMNERKKERQKEKNKKKNILEVNKGAENRKKYRKRKEIE